MLIAPLLLEAGPSGLVLAAASAAPARGPSMAIRGLVFAGLLAAAAIGIAVMSGGGTGFVAPHAHIVSQGVPIASGPVLGPTG
jgi:hypothetical protein